VCPADDESGRGKKKKNKPRGGREKDNPKDDGRPRFNVSEGEEGTRLAEKAEHTQQKRADRVFGERAAKKNAQCDMRKLVLRTERGTTNPDIWGELKTAWEKSGGKNVGPTAVKTRSAKQGGQKVITPKKKKEAVLLRSGREKITVPVNTCLSR